jgi:hypothetical protein
MSGTASAGLRAAGRPGPGRSADPTIGAWRWARGLTVGATSSALALGGHVLGGGHASLPAAAALSAAAVTLSVLWSRRRWTTGALLTVLLVLQLVAHVAFAAGTGGAALTAGHTAGAGMVMSGPHDALAMLTGHLLAAAVTAVLLRRGEHWCWRLVDLTAGAVQAVRLLTGVPAPARTAARAIQASYVVPRPAAVPRAHPRRGPPAALAG